MLDANKHYYYEVGGRQRRITLAKLPGDGGTYLMVATVLVTTRADIDALIAALREARDALPGPGGAEEDAPFTLEPSDIETDEAALDAELERYFPTAARNEGIDRWVEDAEGLAAERRYVERDAPPVRLTRAQRELMEQIDRAPNYPYTASSSVWRRTQALLNRKLIAQGRQEPGHRPICIITDAGRAALAAAQRETGEGR